MKTLTMTATGMTFRHSDAATCPAFVMKTNSYKCRVISSAIQPVRLAVRIIGLCIVSASAYGATYTAVSVATGGKRMSDINGNYLTGGLPTVDHDGAVVQLGYHSAATVGHEFDGVWIPLTDEGSANSDYAHSTVGDRVGFFPPVNNGEIPDRWEFHLGSATAGQNLPAAGTPLAFKFYDSTTIPASYYSPAPLALAGSRQRAG